MDSYQFDVIKGLLGRIAESQDAILAELRAEEEDEEDEEEEESEDEEDEEDVPPAPKGMDKTNFKRELIPSEPKKKTKKETEDEEDEDFEEVEDDEK